MLGFLISPKVKPADIAIDVNEAERGEEDEAPRFESDEAGVADCLR